MSFGATCSLARILRKPPCGYHGLTARQRTEREGIFRWTLDTRPLPPRAVLSREPRPELAGSAH